MIKMNKIASIVILLLVTFTTNAQDKKAKELLDQVTTKIKSHDNIIIDFKYTLNNSKENINKESKGKIGRAHV
jgi:outer membrane lipoprotein-sorting protein